jgi:hypothetical protein
MGLGGFGGDLSSHALFEVEARSGQDQGPEKDGQEGRADAPRRAYVREVVVTGRHEGAHDDVDDGDEASAAIHLSAPFPAPTTPGVPSLALPPSVPAPPPHAGFNPADEEAEDPEDHGHDKHDPQNVGGEAQATEKGDDQQQDE